MTEQVPGTARTFALPRCGHVPMAGDPAAVVDVIVRGAGEVGVAQRD